MRSDRSSLVNSSGGRLGKTGWLRRARLRRRGGFESGMGSGEAGDWNAVGRTGDVVEADRVAELHGARFTAMLTADTDLQFRTDAPTGRYGKSNQLANSIPIKHLEW